jgi:hypothetical protein
MIRRCFCEENAAIHTAAATHRTALESYKQYLADLDYVSAPNKEMRVMERASIAQYLDTNRRAFARFARRPSAQLALAG